MPDRSDEPATQAAGDLSPVPGKGPAQPELTGTHQGRLGGFFKPVDYARSRDTYRPPPGWYRRLGRLGPVVTTLGLSPRDVITLEVPGRRSGVIRRTIMLRTACDGGHYLVALAGESQWVRNVRAAGGRVVIGRRERHAARLAELPPQQRAPIIRAYLWRWGRHPAPRRWPARPAITSASARTHHWRRSRVPPSTIPCSGSSTKAMQTPGADGESDITQQMTARSQAGCPHPSTQPMS